MTAGINRDKPADMLRLHKHMRKSALQPLVCALRFLANNLVFTYINCCVRWRLFAFYRYRAVSRLLLDEAGVRGAQGLAVMDITSRLI